MQASPKTKSFDIYYIEMGHFYKLLCEEMIFLLHKGKNDGLRYEVIFSLLDYGL